MQICFFYGPDKVSFLLDENGRIFSDTTIPFHGIISRGLLNKFTRQQLGAERWLQNAHRLFDKETSPANAELNEIREYARQCNVLSFERSAFCARQYCLHYCETENISDAFIELWNIKEGHTSSVWKITIGLEKNKECFVLNISRDTEAAIELKESSQRLKNIGEKFPGINLARVLDIYSIKDPLLNAEIIITRNEWIENSFEIHSRVNKRSGKEELLMVERFLTGESNPAKVYSIAGRVFSLEEEKKIETDLNEFLTIAKKLPGETNVNIRDGDLVWNGEKAVVVAIS